MQLATDVATIRAMTQNLPKMEQQMESLRRESVPMREHEALMKRTETLWEVYQRLRGAAWLLGVLNVGLVTYVGLHAGRLLP